MFSLFTIIYRIRN